MNYIYSCLGNCFNYNHTLLQDNQPHVDRPLNTAEQKRYPGASLIHDGTHQHNQKMVKILILRLTDGDLIHVRKMYENGVCVNVTRMSANYVGVHLWDRKASLAEKTDKIQKINDFFEQFNDSNGENKINLETRTFSSDFITTRIYFEPYFSADSPEFPPIWVQTILKDLENQDPKFSWSKDFRNCSIY